MVTVLRTPARPTVSSTSHVYTWSYPNEESDCAFCEGRVRRHRHRIRPDCGRHFAGYNPMILDIARLLLFPALMAFAAASDLFTMTISNRVSLALAAGFLILAVLSGMGPYDILLHVGAGAAVLAVAFFCFAMGWVGG